MVNILLSRGIINQGNIYVYLKEYLHHNHRVLLVNFSFFNREITNENDYETIYGINGTYTKRIMNDFFPYGISKDNFAVLDYYKDNKESALAKIKDSDIIYFPGGAPDLLMKRIMKFDLKTAFEDNSKIYIGSSAGALIQCLNYHITPDHDYRHFCYQRGLNLITDYFLEVHYKKRFVTKRSLKKVTKDTNMPIILIPDEGCVIKSDDQFFLINGARIYNGNHK